MAEKFVSENPGARRARLNFTSKSERTRPLIIVTQLCACIGARLREHLEELEDCEIFRWLRCELHN